jgi:hypothetical protein
MARPVPETGLLFFRKFFYPYNDTNVIIKIQEVKEMKHMATLLFGLAAMLIRASCFITGTKEEETTVTETTEDGTINDIKATLALQEVTPEEVNKVAENLYRFVGYCADEGMNLRVEGDIDTSDDSWDITWATLMLVNEVSTREMLATDNAETDEDWNMTSAGYAYLFR